VHARFGLFGALIFAAALAACGGGGGGGGTPATATPTATPAGNSVDLSLSGSSSTSVSLPVPSGASYTGTITFAAGSGSGVLTASTAVPSGASTLNLAAPRTISAAVSKVRAQSSSAPYTAVSYITLTASAAISVTSSGATISASPSSGLYVAYYDNGYWVTLPVTGTFTLASSAAAYFAVYSGGTLPSPNPDGCVGVQPDSITRGGAHTALVGVQPINAGATFDYDGTLTETIDRATPCPIPASTAQASVTVDVTVTSSPGAAIDEHTVETDAYTLQGTTTTTTDASVEATSTPANGFAELNETSTDEAGDVTTTTYGLQPLVYGVSSLPYSGTITNLPPSSVAATLADGTTTARTYQSGGSYTEQDTIAGGTGPNTITVSSDFSGNYAIASYQGALDLAFSAPSQSTIILDVTLGGASQGSLSIPQWWTGNSLYSDSTTDRGPTPLPSPCNPSPAVPSGDDFHRTINIIDPVLGYTETETIDSYVVSDFAGSTTVGPACVVISDQQNIYYDYNYDTPYVIYVTLTGAALQTNTISEAYWYSQAPTGDTSVRTMSAGSGGLAASIAAHASGIAFTRALQRAQRIDAFIHHVATSRLGGLQ